MEVLGEISSFCRFCLDQDSETLMPLSSAIENLSFSVQDILETTGISILETETACLAICTKCSQHIDLAVDFRRSCLNGNILFMQLFGHIIDKLRSSDIAEENLEDVAFAKDDPLEIEIALQNEPNNVITCEEHSEPELLVEESIELLEEPTNNEHEDFAPTTKGHEDCASTTDGQEDCMASTNEQEDFEDENSPEGLLQVSPNTLRSKWKTTNMKVAATASNSRNAKSKERSEVNEGDKTAKPKKRKVSGKARKQLCGICGALVFNLSDHTRSHTKENLLKCPHCPVQMAHASNLFSHVRAIHEKKIIKSCEACGKGFRTYNSYKSHMISFLYSDRSIISVSGTSVKFVSKCLALQRADEIMYSEYMLQNGSMNARFARKSSKTRQS
ncbi:zinc finger and SCAN domain-containing protein 21-like isoform X3 [Anopheles albimanus]|uniref:zinc finger and SCAN domain-containing protein 21-like isoform X3 n=1 Tax=Anopheles albimanus TaxID=7167 RepID=UPI00163FAB0D|nr:zinc finger and SCAN domain-containing protein 21-like isoform X3 [Anopheles albimanus]